MNPRESIIKHSIDLFTKKGFEGTSVRGIANAAGVNVAMISYYFGSKEKLLEKVIEERLSYLRNLFAELVKNNELTAMEKIEQIIDLVIQRKFSNRSFNHLLHRELTLINRPELKHNISDLLMLNITPVKKIIQAGIKSGEFKDVDVEMTVVTIIGTIHYLLISGEMSRKILDKKEGFSLYENKQLQKRLSTHTKQMVKAYLRGK